MFSDPVACVNQRRYLGCYGINVVHFNVRLVVEHTVALPAAIAGDGLHFAINECLAIRSDLIPTVAACPEAIL